MKPPHKHFFTSLKQVEKRLKLDDGNPPPPPPQQPPPPPPQTETQSTESSTSSPIYFHNHHTNTSSTLNNNSIEQPPQEFLSINDTPQLHNLENSLFENDAVGGVDSMFELLGLSDFDCKGAEMPEVGDDEFFDKIVKVKGPKCKKEVERLDNWIKYFLNSGREPLRLAHLLMAKAAVVAAAGGDELEFPCTVDEFLENDPPTA